MGLKSGEAVICFNYDNNERRFCQTQALYAHKNKLLLTLYDQDSDWDEVSVSEKIQTAAWNQISSLQKIRSLLLLTIILKPVVVLCQLKCCRTYIFSRKPRYKLQVAFMRQGLFLKQLYEKVHALQRWIIWVLLVFQAPQTKNR